MRRQIWPFLIALLRAILFVGLVAGAIPVVLRPVARIVVPAVDHVVPGFLAPLVPVLVGQAILFGIVVALTVAMSGLARRPMARNGLPFSRRGRQLLVAGIGVGLAGMMLVVTVIAALESYAILGWAYGLGTACMVATWCAATYLLVGMSEELWFRGFPLAVLSRPIGFWPAALLLSLAFGLAHGFNPGEDWSSELLIALAGLALCLLRRLTGSLWFGIGAHAGFDYAQGVVFSGPDSGVNIPAEHLLVVWTHGPDWLTGGTAGYENSLPGAAMGLMLILLPALWFQYRKTAT